MDSGRCQSRCDVTQWFSVHYLNKKTLGESLFVRHLTESLGFLSFSVFQWRIWLIWKINQAHWLGWQLWRKTNQAEGCLFVMDVSDLLPFGGRSRSLTTSHCRLAMTLACVHKLALWFLISKSTNSVSAVFVKSRHQWFRPFWSWTGRPVLFCCNTFNTV